MKIHINTRKKGGFTLIELIVVIAILGVLATYGYGPIMAHLQDGDRQLANSNLGQLQKILVGFRNDHGDFPCDRTADELAENTDYDFGELKGDHSNAYFRQLFYKHTNTEKTFYGKIQGAKEPDDKIANGQALTKQENVMSYAMLKPKAGEEDLGRRGVTDSKAPLAFCCVAKSRTPWDGTNLQFDMNAFRGGHAFMVGVDGAVKPLVDQLEEDDSGDLGKPKNTLFPETKKGRDTTGDYIVLTPDL